MAAYATRTLFRFALIMLIAGFAASVDHAQGRDDENTGRCGTLHQPGLLLLPAR